ncbi:MAG: hypothetical protein ACLTFX_00515 [Phocaeicola vulgatus]
MIKTYKANTNVSINVVLPSKKNLHISFTPLSNGSSLFTTDSEDIMRAIEKHYNFGKLFRLHSMQDESEKINAKTEENLENNEMQTVDNQVAEEDSQGEETTGGNEPTLKKVRVSDLSAAKDYLADTFGISRTAMRSMKAITEQAAANGIEFDGLS